MDFIRSAYVVDARFYRDLPDVTAPMQWSFVTDKTPGMPFAHAFWSKTWDIDEIDDDDVGETAGPRTWKGGTPPFPLPLVGPLGIDDLGLCGSKEQWQLGALSTDPVPDVWPNTQVKRCCRRPPEIDRGGVKIGAILANQCGQCAAMPGLLFLSIAADPGQCTFMDGTYLCRWKVDAWYWTGVPPNSADGKTWTFRLFCASTPDESASLQWYAQDTDGNFGSAINPAAADCLGNALGAVWGFSSPSGGCILGTLGSTWLVSP